MRPESPGLLLPAVKWTAWAVFLFMWLQVALHDQKNQKILHLHLRRGLAFAAACYGLMLASSAAGQLGWVSVFYRWPFYLDLAAHVVTSAAVALAMWRAGVWPAGDTKLFVLLSLIFPMMEVSGSFHGGWLFLLVLINTFIPASVVVFWQALRWVWQSRLKHQSSFMRQMGLRRAFDYASERLRANAPRLLGEVRGAWEGLKENPLSLLSTLLSWAVSMFLMAALSLLLKDLVASPLLRTLLCFAALFTWSRATSAVGGGLPLLVSLAGAAALIVSRTPALWAELGRSFGYMTVFSIFVFMGMRWTLGAVAGEVLMFAFPLLGMVVGFVPWLLSALAFPHLDLSWAARYLPLAGLGLFFGLSFVFVRIWDNEDHPDVPPEKLLSYMVLHHSFHDKLRQDEDFYERHFARTYADGLTEEQAEALRQWAKVHQVPTIPLTTTMAFSHWIFLGYFLTWCLGGHVLQGFY